MKTCPKLTPYFFRKFAEWKNTYFLEHFIEFQLLVSWLAVYTAFNISIDFFRLKHLKKYLKNNEITSKIISLQKTPVLVKKLIFSIKTP